MRVIIEFDGPVFDVAAAYHRVHGAVAAELGWSRLDRGTFWRRFRRDGRQADLLPAARPVKRAAYDARYTEALEADSSFEAYEAWPGIDEILTALHRHGAFCLVTLGANIAARRCVLERAGLERHFSRFDALNSDVRKRPGELRAIAGGDQRTIVAAAGDLLIRAANAAELVTAGISCGPCSAERLHQAGAGVVYRDLAELQSSLRTGAADLARAGLLPPPNS